MGGVQSKNIATENIDAIASVINDAVQNCGQRVSEEVYQNIQAQGIDVGGDFTLNADNVLIVKEACLQSETAVNDLDQSLQAAASQAAAAISQQLELSSAKAKNVIDINAQIASSIKNEFVQNCSLQDFQEISQNVTLTDDTIGGSVIIDAKNYTDSLVSCSTQGSATDRLRQRLEIEIEQEATAKVENFFAPFFIALAIIIGIIALFLFIPMVFRGKKETPTQAPSDDGALGLLAAIGSESPPSTLTTSPSTLATSQIASEIGSSAISSI